MAVIKYPGSKKSIARWIIEHFPAGYKKMTYLEPFFGSGCVFFCKEPSQIETINEIDGEITNLFTQIRENTEQLVFLVENTPWGRDDYVQAFEKSDSPVEQARRFLVRAWFSIGSAYRDKSSIRINIKKATGGHEYFHQKLPEILRETSKRLKNEAGRYVQIENRDALQLIPKYDREDVLIYLDPPYVCETRNHKKIYSYEMSNEEHIRLLELISGLKACVLISGYDNELYRRYLKDWNKDTATSTDEAGNKRTECLWFNYNTRQYDLFSHGGGYAC
jgi:DNA adenine methylase